MPTMTEKTLLTPEDIANQLGKSVDTVMRLFRKREIPGFKIGGQWYIKVEDWQQYLEERKNTKK